MNWDVEVDINKSWGRIESYEQNKLYDIFQELIKH